VARATEEHAAYGIGFRQDTPPPGTVITAAQTLSATFTPTDTTHYNTVIATVPIALRTGTHPDTGAVKLFLNNSPTPVATYYYGANDTPSTVAEGLAAASSSSLVTVKAVDNTLYIEATPAAVSAYTGAGTDFSYTIQNAGYNTSGTNYTYPSFPASLINGQLEGGATGSSGSNPVTVYSFAGSYDGVSNLASYTDSVMGSWNFSYDTLNRLVSSQNTAASSATPQFAGNYGCWSYDGFGNRLSQAISTTPCASSPPLMSWANYNSNNQFTSTSQAPGGVPYDASGDVLNDGQNQYLYDGEGRICAVASSPMPNVTTMTGYLYDADGTRVAKGRITAWSCDPGVNGFQTTNDYILGLGGEQLTEMGVDATAGSSATTLAWQHTNVYAAGALIATYDNDGLHFYFNDPLGTRRTQTDYTGVLEQTCSSLPFGDALACSGGNLQAPTEHHFTGKERDTESGNDYFEARYFGSSMGRMLSPDPIGGDLSNPQSLNKYAYALNNPLRFTDPTGLYVCRDGQDCSAFEKVLASLRDSTNADVARAAAAYGALGEDNGVTVGFADMSKKGENGKTVSTIELDPKDSSGKTLRAHSDVTINSKISGDAYASAVGHEGSHAADAQDVVKSSLTPDGNAIHAGMNITPYQSEQRAYGVTNAILASGNQSQKFDCGMKTCTLGAGSGLPVQLPGVIDQILAHDHIYDQGGKPMSSTNQGPSVVNGITPMPPNASVPQ
jgi:RHS repeat-associated protein